MSMARATRARPPKQSDARCVEGWAGGVEYRQEAEHDEFRIAVEEEAWRWRASKGTGRSQSGHGRGMMGNLPVAV